MTDLGTQSVLYIRQMSHRGASIYSSLQPSRESVQSFQSSARAAASGLIYAFPEYTTTTIVHSSRRKVAASPLILSPLPPAVLHFFCKLGALAKLNFPIPTSPQEISFLSNLSELFSDRVSRRYIIQFLTYKAEGYLDGPGIILNSQK